MNSTKSIISILVAGAILTAGAAVAQEAAWPVSANSKVCTTRTGLQYYDIEQGRGPTPAPGSYVSVHYTGWLLNKQKFDSSLDRGQPIEFQLGSGQVIRGWDEGVGSMKVGGKRRLVIPAQLAYGANGRPPVIPPNSTLVFDVQLVNASPTPTQSGM